MSSYALGMYFLSFGSSQVPNWRTGRTCECPWPRRCYLYPAACLELVTHHTLVTKHPSFAKFLPKIEGGFLESRGFDKWSFSTRTGDELSEALVHSGKGEKAGYMETLQDEDTDNDSSRSQHTRCKSPGTASSAAKIRVLAMSFFAFSLGIQATFSLLFNSTFVFQNPSRKSLTHSSQFKEPTHIST